MSKSGQKRFRSPNFPYFDLKTAIEKGKALFADIGRHAVGPDIIIEKMGYTPKSSSGAKGIAALRAFGIFEDAKVDGDQKTRFSSRGLDIVADYPESSPEWTGAVKMAALAPKLHRELWDRWPDGLPPDEEVKRYLLRVREQRFSDSGATEFIDEFRKTLAYAKLVAGDKIEGGGQEDGNGGTPENGGPPLPPPLKRRQMQPGMKEDVFSLEEGSVVLQWPERLSKTSAEDLQDWLDLIGRKIKRAIDAPQVDDDEEPAGGE